MNQEIKRSVLVAAALAVMLAGCNKEEATPTGADNRIGSAGFAGRPFRAAVDA